MELEKKIFKGLFIILNFLDAWGPKEHKYKLTEYCMYKKKNLYTKISYYILVMNISMDEFVRIGIDFHEIHYWWG